MAKKLTNQEKGAVVFLIGAALWAYWNYLYKPITNEITKLEKTLVQKQSTLESTRRAAQELEVLEAEFVVLELEAKEIEKKLPKEMNLPKLIRDITKSLEKHKLNVQNFAPTKGAPKTYYAEIPISLNITGSYHKLADFLSEVGQYERVFNVADVMLTPLTPTKEKPDTITASFRLITYMAN
ncbi:MAG: type 4a pilus biogenesis protein PilO [Elusimicrobia bacterium]|nr:type 4a pilus biogenesis protein PilO [Elusimicrobiota bacterium]